MHLSVVHETHYTYAPAVDVAQHVACLQPLQTPTQRLLAHTLEIDPPPLQRSTRVDVFGNLRSYFSLQAPHAELRLVASSRVQTQAVPVEFADPPWEQVQEQLRYRANGPYDPDGEFVFNSPCITRQAEFADYARPSFTPGTGLHAGACALMAHIHGQFRYDPQSTHVHTPAIEALARRQGVCQDFAHVMIACLRSLGLAARYVSGYLLTEAPAGQPRLVGSDASHAWVSVLLPATQGPLRWCDFDPTNNRWGWGAPGPDYVVLAVGRDYADVSPIRGVIHGGAHHQLSVAVTVAPVEETTPATAPGCAPQDAPAIPPATPQAPT